MLIVERQQLIINILREQNAADLDSLAQTIGVSPSTIRRDLEALERQGLIERTHGGAMYRGEYKHPVAFDERRQENVTAKKAIGRYAASLVEPNMTLLLDGGSTVYYAAQQIAARPLQVVTNSLTIASLFADDEHVDLVMLGGELYPRTGVLVGPLATHSLQQLHADLLLFSLAGIHEDEAFNLNLKQAEVEQIMLQQAARAVMLMDATKFGRKSLARVCSTHDVEQIVTDTSISTKYAKQFGDQLILAE